MSESKPENAGPQPEPSDAVIGRRPYQSPSLRRLGSVRELTLGSKGSTGDGGFTKKHP